MKNILILQTDNRNVDYLTLTRKLSKFICNHLNETAPYPHDYKYTYLFLDMEKYKKENKNPCTTKIHVMNDILNTAVSIKTTTQTITTITTKTTSTIQSNATLLPNYTNCAETKTKVNIHNAEVPNATMTTHTDKTEDAPDATTTIETRPYDAVIFLDSDAWIQDFHNLHKLMTTLLEDGNNQPQYQGCFSRDPYLKKNTYINSGSFILRVNEYTKRMYRELLENLEKDPSHWDKHPYDQYYISNYVFQHKQDFMVFKPAVLNTPLGSVIRHNWWKTRKMYVDLYGCLEWFHSHKIPDAPTGEIKWENEFDDWFFPNENEEGYEYFV